MNLQNWIALGMRHVIYFVSVVVALTSLSTPALAMSRPMPVSYIDYDCIDFGTRERAQAEFNKFKYDKGKRDSDGNWIGPYYDKYGLDADDDGQACELNPSPGKWAFGFSAVSIVLGRYAGRRKRFGTKRVLPFPRGLIFRSLGEENGKPIEELDDDSLMILGVTWWIPYVLMTILRDNYYPKDVSPSGLIVTTFIIGFCLTFGIASKTENWI